MTIFDRTEKSESGRAFYTSTQPVAASRGPSNELSSRSRASLEGLLDILSGLDKSSEWTNVNIKSTRAKEMSASGACVVILKSSISILS